MDETGKEIEPGIVHFIAKVGPPGLGPPEFGIMKFSQDRDSELQKALESDTESELYEELIADAQTAVYQRNLRRSVLELAIACEIAIKQTFFAKSTPAGLAYEYLEDKGRINISVMELIDGVANQAFGESFKDIDLKAYTDIDHLFRSRNKVAHRGKIIYRDDKGLPHQVDTNTLKAWWQSVESLLNWLQKHRL
jgi:hypothetical protein